MLIGDASYSKQPVARVFISGWRRDRGGSEWSTRGHPLVEDVDGFLVGKIGQKSGLSREILADPIKI
jgi:hypothetical protein